MKPSIALNNNSEAIRSLVAQYSVTNLRVFGSTSRGEDKEGSDLDLLIDALPGTTLLDLGDLQYHLEQLLGVPVDVRTPGDLNHRIRQKVLDEAQPL